VHPENYKVVEKMARIKNVEVESLIGDPKKLEYFKSENFELGAFAFNDLIDDLSKQGYDPRKKIRKFEFDRSIESIQDLKIGMELPGLVENITNFGAFINIGIKEKGLVHVSEIANQYVSNPHEHLEINDYVKARVISVDMDRKRIGLSLKKG
jgi:uncharacterized protein